MRVVFDWQHTGKPSAPRDVGCVVAGETEVDITGRYIGAARSRLHSQGHEVVVLADGEYGERAARANALRPALYVACHVNAASTPVDYGAVFYWPNSTKGKAAAEAVAAKLRPLCPWQDMRVLAAGDGWERVRACIRSVVAPAILLEPGFLTGAHGGPWLVGDAEKIGEAIADGIHGWSP